MTILAATASQAPDPLAGQVSFPDILARASQSEPPTTQIAYGPASAQFGWLWLPESSRRDPATRDHGVPVVMLLHGGCWLNSYGVDHVQPLATALTKAGIAVWAPEYRRIGDPGGGNPGTFEDIRASWAALLALAPIHGLDPDRVLLMGHSAGGQLALWLAGEPEVTLRGVLSLAGITDLEAFRAHGGCGASVEPLLGGTPDDVPEAFEQYSPVQRPALGPSVPVLLVVAEGDTIVPEAQARDYAARDPHARLLAVPGGHFDLIAPWAPAWPLVLSQIQAQLNVP